MPQGYANGGMVYGYADGGMVPAEDDGTSLFQLGAANATKQFGPQAGQPDLAAPENTPTGMYNDAQGRPLLTRYGGATTTYGVARGRNVGEAGYSITQDPGFISGGEWYDDWGRGQQTGTPGIFGSDPGTYVEGPQGAVGRWANKRLTPFDRGFDPASNPYAGVIGRPPPPDRSWDVSGVANGGMIPGLDPRDTIPAMLRPGEGIMTPEAVHLMGGPEVVNSLNEMATGRPAGPQYAQAPTARAGGDAYGQALQQSGGMTVGPNAPPPGGMSQTEFANAGKGSSRLTGTERERKLQEMDRNRPPAKKK